MPIQVSCPSCAAPVGFRSAGSALAVCGFCRSTLARDGETLKNLGRMAELLADDSPLQIGSTGTWRGSAFAVLGRLQLRYDAGFWNEWHLLFDDQRSGWLSESGGQWTLTLPQPLDEPVPAFAAIEPGTRLVLAGKAFEVTNKEEAVCFSGEGELPFAVGPGYIAPVVDLRLGDAFASLDYSDIPPHFYLGEAVERRALKLANLRDQAREALVATPRKKAEALACPGCGSPWALHDQNILAVACPACGAVSDVDGAVAKVREAARAGSTITPALPLGSRGRLDGQDWEAIGFLRKTVPGESDADWDEYLLYDGKGGFAWLASERGHWNFIRQLNTQPKPASGYGKQGFVAQGHSFEHFAHYIGESVFVLGEFTWKVAVGERTEVTDYVAPPRVLSREKTANEITWSLGEYLTPQAVAEAFGLKRPLVSARGVNACQPNPYLAQRWPLILAFLFFALVASAIHGFIGGAAARTVYSTEIALAPGQENTLSSEPFKLDRELPRLELEHYAPVSNTWASLDVELVNQATGQSYSAQHELAYYSGEDEDGSWSEGRQKGGAVFYGVPAGEYHLAVRSEFAPDAPGEISDRITLRAAPAPFSNLLICLLLLLVMPVFNWMRGSAFETARWAWSDHPRSSSDDEDDD